VVVLVDRQKADNLVLVRADPDPDNSVEVMVKVDMVVALLVKVDDQALSLVVVVPGLAAAVVIQEG